MSISATDQCQKYRLRSLQCSCEKLLCSRNKMNSFQERYVVVFSMTHEAVSLTAPSWWMLIQEKVRAVFDGLEVLLLYGLIKYQHMTFLPRHKAHFYDRGALQTSFSARPSLHTVAHPGEGIQTLLKLNIPHLGSFKKEALILN